MEIKINSEKFGEQTILIDDEDYEKIKGKSLSLFKNSRAGKEVLYVRTSWINGKRFLLHRFLTDCPKDKLIDHINHNPLDNRKSNLRICNNAENKMNMGRYKTNKESKYKGVFIYNKIITAAIGFNGKPIHLGKFQTQKDAAKAYNKKAIELFGEFAYLNEITPA